MHLYLSFNTHLYICMPAVNCLFNFSQAHECIKVSHCGFNLPLSDDVEHISFAYWILGCPLFKCLFKTFAWFSIDLPVFFLFIVMRLGVLEEGSDTLPNMYTVNLSPCLLQRDLWSLPG